nr:NUDIX domain protein [uncultured bacterium]AIA19275.1 NUDIX domain protein [uncultured bacterium]
MNVVQTIGVIVFSGDAVLLVKHTEGAEHKTGIYGLPSGRMEHGEGLEEAAIRELREETGLIAERLFQLPETYFAEMERKSGERIPMEMSVFLLKEFTGNLHRSIETIPEWVPVEKMHTLPLLPNIENAVKAALPYKDTV